MLEAVQAVQPIALLLTSQAARGAATGRKHRHQLQTNSGLSVPRIMAFTVTSGQGAVDRSVLLQPSPKAIAAARVISASCSSQKKASLMCGTWHVR